MVQALPKKKRSSFYFMFCLHFIYFVCKIFKKKKFQISNFRIQNIEIQNSKIHKKKKGKERKRKLALTSKREKKNRKEKKNCGIYFDSIFMNQDRAKPLSH
jgi:hypothetical protein